MLRARRISVLLVTAVTTAGAAAVVPLVAGAAETAMAISTTALDFGTVDVGTTASSSVTLTNTGGVPFGPINMFGGAPPTAEFNASQNCQGQTLPAGGSCSVTYAFTPSAAGNFTDASSFTISNTASQSDGENFSVSLAGTGSDPTATTTTTTSTTTTTTSTTTTTEPTATTTSAVSEPTTQPSNASPTPTSPTAPAPTEATSTPADTTTTTTVPRFPLTGVAFTPQPAIVVKIDNVDAEPQSGLNQADIVFEEIVEGSATRFAAVFHSTEANPVGPIRSARTQDLDLLAALNDPALVYSGANEAVNEALQAAGIEAFGEDTPGFFRRDDLTAPHNLYANLAAIRPQIVSSGDAAPVFQYLEPDATVAGTPVTFASLLVGSYDVRWDWDAVQGLFLRSQLGSPHELADGRASADNVVVLVVPYGTSAAGGGPEADTIGSGQAVVYSDGQRVEGTWSRAAPTDPFTLEAGGAPILLSPGRTWVELVDADHQLTDG